MEDFFASNKSKYNLRGHKCKDWRLYLVVGARLSVIYCP